MLFISGEKDHIMPASLNITTANKYKKGSPSSITEQKTFPGRDRMICGERGWQEVADYAIDWVEKRGGKEKHSFIIRSINVSRA